VQVTPRLALQAIIIPSGGSHHFAADKTNIRICTLSSGKLRVQLQGEKEYTIGSHGMFVVRRGLGCTVLNRTYVDGIMHVTTSKDR
jgi:hypothetical protein